jgi:lipoate-protein ligase B
MPMSKSQPIVRSCWLGSVPYRQAWDVQLRLAAAIEAGTQPDTLLLLEHPHVFSFGRRARQENLLWGPDEVRRRQVEEVWSDRGGDVTYHGPGQLVGYPLLDLRRHGGDLHRYIRNLELSMIAYLALLGVEAEAVPGLTGVWSQGEKVGAIGIKLLHHVTLHGFALNLTTDLDYFDGIVPCGLPDKRATSVEKLIGTAPVTSAATTAFGDCFASTFGVEIAWARAESVVQPDASEVGMREQVSAL